MNIGHHGPDSLKQNKHNIKGIVFVFLFFKQGPMPDTTLFVSGVIKKERKQKMDSKEVEGIRKPRFHLMM